MEDPANSSDSVLEVSRFSKVLFCIIGILVLVGAYWVAGQCMGSVNAELLPAHELVSGSSYIVDVNARMLERELNTGWAPSARLTPIWVRTDMRQFQQGMLDVVTKSTQELNHIFRVGSESTASDDLKEAANDVDRPANDWSIFSANSTYDRLRDAVRRLDHFNVKLADGKSPLISARIDLVASEINDYVVLLSDEHTKLEAVATNGHAVLGVRAPFYRAQGVLAGVCLEMKASRQDFQQVLELQSVLSVFDQAIDKTCETLGVRPLPVVNGSGYSFWGGNIKTLSEHIGTVLYNLSAVQGALAAAPVSHPAAPPALPH